jgi:hypothetical protein
MTKQELHRQDVEEGILQVVQAGGRCHVVKPDPEAVGRWTTIKTDVWGPIERAADDAARGGSEDE